MSTSITDLNRILTSDFWTYQMSITYMFFIMFFLTEGLYPIFSDIFIYSSILLTMHQQ